MIDQGTDGDELYETLVKQLVQVRESIRLLESTQAPRAEERARLEMYRRHEERLASEVDAIRHGFVPSQL